jgi:hypothetical protein
MLPRSVSPGPAPRQVGSLPCMNFCCDTLWNSFVVRIFSLERAQDGYIRMKPVMDRNFAV